MSMQPTLAEVNSAALADQAALRVIRMPGKAVRHRFPAAKNFPILLGRIRAKVSGAGLCRREAIRLTRLCKWLKNFTETNRTCFHGRTMRESSP